MDIFENFIVIYLKKLTVPNILVQNLTTNYKYVLQVSDGSAEISPGLNKVFLSIINFNFSLRISRLNHFSSILQIL